MATITLANVGPYSAEAYAAAQQLQNGGTVAPYAPGVAAAAQEILSKQPAQQTAAVAAPSTGPSATDYQSEAQYWQDQQALLDQQLGRIPTQQAVGQGNIDSSYGSAFNTLTQQQQQANRDLATTKNNTVQDNITAKNAIDDSVNQTSTGLQRLLQSRGAGVSSAAQIVAPYAAAVQGNQQRGQVQNAYGRNMQAIDTSQGDTDTKFTGAFGDLLAQKTNKQNALQSSLDQTQAGILQQKADAALQASQASGAGYGTAKAAEAPFLSRLQQLLGNIDQLGAQQSFTPQAVAYTPPSLSSYDYNPSTVANGAAAAGVPGSQASQVGPYYTLLQDQQKKQQGALATA